MIGLKEIKTEIEIKASASTAWQALTQLHHYPQWNPFVIKAEGVLAVGSKLTNTLQTAPGKTMTFSPRIIDLQPGRRLEWLGHLWVPGLFDGRHYFEIEETPTGCRLTHGERFSGLLSGPIMRSIYAQTVANFEAMNRALKARAEEMECGC